MASRVRVGVVGLGRVSGGHLQGWKKCSRATLAAVCDTDEERVKSARKQYGSTRTRGFTNYTEMLAAGDIDAVDICLPDFLHREVVLEAAAAGKHILCEKPLGMNAEEAEEMLAAVEAAGVVHQLRLQRRHSRLCNYVRHLIAQGALGELRHFRCTFAVGRIADPNVKLEWRLQADQGCYGVLGDLGAHAIDLAFFTMGEAAGQVLEARAMPAIFIPAREYEDGKGVGQVTGYDAISFCLRYETGVLGTFTLSRFMPGEDSWQVDGQDASVRVSGSSGDKFLWFQRVARDDQIPASQFVERTIPKDFPHPPGEFDVFCKAVQKGASAMPDFSDGLRVSQVLDMVAAAAR